MKSFLPTFKGLSSLLLAFCLGRTAAMPGEAPVPQTIEYEGGLFVELGSLEAFGFQFSDLGVGARTVDVRLAGEQWQIQNGGDRISGNRGKEVLLHHPLLVEEGRLYLHAKDASDHFEVRLDASRISFQGRSINHQPRQLGPAFRQHRVEGLERRNAAVKLKEGARGLPSLRDGKAPVPLDAGQVYLARRACRVDGADCLVVTGTGRNPESFLVPAGAVAETLPDGSLEGTVWQRRLDWFLERARRDQAFRRAESSELRAVAVTADLCWSLRPYEKTLFDLAEREAGAGRQVAISLFVSGRWMEQHPSEMTALIRLGEVKGVDLLWGLHSWSHPKTGDFMNDFTLEEVIQDTLKLEAYLLAWGIVPAAYYRFPGLIHNPERLETVLSLGLLPIDCDAWIAVHSPKGKHPFGGPVRGGSIVLLHGNGNEPRGIERFLQWWGEHRDWSWEPLHRLLPNP